MKLISPNFEQTLAAVRHHSERAMFCRCRFLHTIPVKEYNHEALPARQAADVIPFDDSPAKRARVPIHQLDDAMDRFIEQAPTEFSVPEIIAWFDSIGLNAPHGQVERYIRDGAGGAISFIGYRGPKQIFTRSDPSP